MALQRAELGQRTLRALARATTGGPRCRRGRRRPSSRCRPPRPWPRSASKDAIDASSCATVSAARACASGLDFAPPVVLGAADGLLDLLEPALEVLHLGARHLAGGVPLLGQLAERVPCGLGVRRPAATLLGLDEQRALHLGVAAYSASSFAFVCVAGTEERVLRGAEPLPQRVVDVLLRTAGRLPLRHQVAVGTGGRTPVGRRRQLLGLDDELLLDDPGALALLVELGEVLLAPPGVRRPGRREPMPQLVVGGLVDPRQPLPLVEQLDVAG